MFKKVAFGLELPFGMGDVKLKDGQLQTDDQLGKIKRSSPK